MKNFKLYLNNNTLLRNFRIRGSILADIGPGWSKLLDKCAVNEITKNQPTCSTMGTFYSLLRATQLPSIHCRQTSLVTWLG